MISEVFKSPKLLKLSEQISWVILRGKTELRDMYRGYTDLDTARLFDIARGYISEEDIVRHNVEKAQASCIADSLSRSGYGIPGSYLEPPVLSFWDQVADNLADDVSIEKKVKRSAIVKLKTRIPFEISY